MNTYAEIACSEAAVHVISEYALERKLNQIQLAMLVPGVVHTHSATTEPTSDCVYCQRNGNIFNPKQKIVETDDIIGRYRIQVEDLLEEMKAEIMAVLDNVV